MMKLAYLFAGQGAQYVGMAKELYDTEEVVKETFDEASQVLGYDLAEIVFQDGEKLNKTEYTQPSILTVSTAISRVLKTRGVSPDLAIGLSLGEYSALVESGVLDFKEAVQLVKKRGKFMTEAAPHGSGKMVAIMNADVSVIEEACKKASVKGIVTPANYNTPSQIVIGGVQEAVDYAVELLTEAGVKRMIPLNVSGPFHTAILKPASEKLAVELEKTSFSELKIPVISNTTAKPFKDGEIPSLLTRQVMEPVRFYESIDALKGLGVTHFIEIGPGKTLSGFMKKIDKTILGERAEDIQTVEASARMFKGE
ncbi:MAG: ACP S-malonyltransferase [Streptococcaceae bacterium]|jgi:[acyl-carrier-protein] S-malonyltransferase|nr:ACP S-malonyltransferase [Streptococcaceae bacterium]